MSNKSKGFTLIEMLVVVAIMIVMVAIGTVSYGNAAEKNRDNKRLADLERIRMALEVFRQTDVGGSYPPASSGQAAGLVSGGYIDVWPEGPKGSGAGDTYVYTRVSSYRYTIRTKLEGTGVGYSLTNP